MLPVLLRSAIEKEALIAIVNLIDLLYSGHVILHCYTIPSWKRREDYAGSGRRYKCLIPYQFKYKRLNSNQQ
jgi:hypothetical protein